eukprot:gnl/Hemi2/18723_TR6195_c0_g1_i1.p1 gnl/Hemi2/18723_TR6195_c0_g1~~gnl/Hemi2/18723_TR6195_c0_g1_i1.p1  ORF type:complete len:247 (-),score=29.35 gnl/Hemi2/18723_TR6195_c0_g1_i1:48-731(-)
MLVGRCLRACKSRSLLAACSKRSCSSSASTGEEVRTAVLAAALQHVRTQGWSVAALAAGAIDAQLSPASHGLFPRGGAELVEFFQRQSLAAMSIKLASQNLASMRIRDRITLAVRTHLEHIIPYIQQWPQALALQSIPYNVPQALHNKALLVDEMWFQAGDKSTDLNWYTKRGLLAAVHASTELHMLVDSTADFSDSWAFLDRRIEDVMYVGPIVGKVVSCSSASKK